MKRVLLFTASFPFEPGEQFLESEVQYWANTSDVSLTVVPTHAGNQIKRELPRKIGLNLSLTELGKGVFKRALGAIKALISNGVYSEIIELPQPDYRKYWSIVVAHMKFHHRVLVLEKFFDQFEDDKKVDILYFYWHTELSYAASVLAKKHGFTVVSRLHRFDIYQEVMWSRYKPIKRSLSHLDVSYYVLSESAKEYLTTTYGYPARQITVAPLGVIDREKTSLPGSDKQLMVVTCSSFARVKSLEMLPGILAILRDKGQETHWTHIGGSESDAVGQSIRSDMERRSLEYRHIPSLSNYEVLEYYGQNKVDVFLNVSQSEGQPVSIMEAMSFGIPIVAPDIGGIFEMYRNGASGILMSSNPSIEDVASALDNRELFRKDAARQSVRQDYLERFDASKNYQEFISSLIG